MEEFTERGEEAKAKALEYLRSWHARSVHVMRRRWKLERLRVEKEKRDREDRERQIAEQARKILSRGRRDRCKRLRMPRLGLSRQPQTCWQRRSATPRKRGRGLSASKKRRYSGNGTGIE